MELTSKRLRYRIYSFAHLHWDHLLLPILGVGLVLMDQAFLFNPFLLTLFFISYSRSGWTYLFTIFLMTFTAFFVYVSYGMECILLAVTYFFLSFFFSRTSFHQHPYARFYPLGILSIFLTTIMLIHVASFETFFYCLLCTIFAFFFSFQLEKVTKALDDDFHSVSSFSWMIGALFLFISSMCLPILGFIFLRFILLWAVPKSKKEIGLLFASLAFFLLHFYYQYGVNIICMVVLPCLLSYFVSDRYRYLTYGGALLVTMVLFDSRFYTNGLFYQGLFVMLVCYSIPKLWKQNYDAFITRERTLEYRWMLHKEESLKTEILRLEQYLSAIDFGFDEEVANPKEKAVQRVTRRVCMQCEHAQYCKIPSTLLSWMNHKLTNEQRKQLAKDCIKPYKMTLEMQQAFHIYVEDESYYLETIKRKNALLQILKALYVPLQAFQKEIKNDLPLEQRFINTCQVHDIPIVKMDRKKQQCYFTFSSIPSETQLEDMKSILQTYFSSAFTLIDSTYFPLKKQFQAIYAPLPSHQVSYLVYSKAVHENVNGDYYYVHKTEQEFALLLCDGMGHDEKAQKTSQALAKAFMSLYQVDENVEENAAQINDIFRIGSSEENYATFDFIRISLQTLHMQNYKGGSAPAFLIREGKIRQLKTGGLPVGLLDEVDLMRYDEALEKGDILLCISDGLSEFMEEQSEEIFKNIEDIPTFFRNLFQVGTDHMKHLDDATMIVLQIL